MHEFKADLHIHTCLSPCAEDSMTPATIIEKAAEKSLNIIAVCDHNCADNAAAVAENSGDVLVLPGMEITTSEEVHILGIFGDMASVTELQKKISTGLCDENKEDIFGRKIVTDSQNRTNGLNSDFLPGVTGMSVSEVVNLIHELGGLAIASHIDREGYGIVGKLGFIPEDTVFDALEISSSVCLETARKNFPEYCQYPFVQSSDAHHPEDIGKAFTVFSMESLSFKSLKTSLAKMLTGGEAN